MQRFLGLSGDLVRTYRAEIQRIKLLQQYRSGKLPRTTTNTILEGGEICHWEAACTYGWQTATKYKMADGRITLTDKRIVFTSDVRNFEFKPGRVMDIRPYSNGLDIKTTSSRGTGCYLVSDAESFEAILTGLVRRHKFLAADNFSSSRSRHIPDDVKREVWSRDGGRCVKCEAEDYAGRGGLEFDHILPFSRGGANTVKNLQLLCRLCNQLKGDRI